VNLLILSIFALPVLSAALFVSCGQDKDMRRACTESLGFWAGLLPSLATLIFLLLPVLYLGHIELSPNHQWLLLQNEISSFEVILLLVAGIFFVTAYGNLIAAIVVLYGLERTLLTSSSELTPAMLLLLSSATIVAVLADKMPWHPQHAGNEITHRVREIASLALCFCGLALAFAAALKMAELTQWVSATFAPTVTQEGVSIGMLAIIVGWVFIAMGTSRHYLMPVVIVPTLALVCFLTNWPAAVLVLPFCLALSLSLAVFTMPSRITIFR